MFIFDYYSLYELINNNTDRIKDIIFILIASFIIRLVLSFTGHSWIRSRHQTMTYLILPFVAYIIASVIMNNIALSLGMIGALSIVRFRNPVKSPFELVMFFSLLTLGIATTVEIQWGLLLIIVLCFIIILTYLYEKYMVSFGFKPFVLSFEEGLPLHFMEIVSLKKIDTLAERKELINYAFSQNEKTYIYKLAFKKKSELDNLYKEINLSNEITSIDIRHSNY